MRLGVAIAAIVLGFLAIVVLYAVGLSLEWPLEIVLPMFIVGDFAFIISLLVVVFKHQRESM